MKSNKLASAMRGNSASNLTRTENNAVTYKSTLSRVLDFFYHAPVRRGQDNEGLFNDALQEDMALALKALFYLRDVRQGKGERDTFRKLMKFLARREPKLFDALVNYVPEYGRWDDLTEVFPGYRSVQELVTTTLREDYRSDGNVTLLGKWMPSENAGKTSRELALRWISTLGVTPKAYRKILTRLREKIGIPETTMSQGDWDELDYAKVPARAMKLYARAFSRHDGTRFGKYLEKAIKGDVEIKTSGIYPHELTYQVRQGNWSKAIEAQWKQLPDFFPEDSGNVMVVVDTSSSMYKEISKSHVQAVDVSVGLGIYCAEHNKGAFAGLVLTFNTESEIAVVEGKNLKEKWEKVYNLGWGGSTNVQSAFENILGYATRNRVPQEEMPTNVVVISDMEFNENETRQRQYLKKTNLEGIRSKYAEAGYEMPKLTFWNVDSRHDQTPATKDENGVFLVSGFSAETIGKVLGAKAVNPEELMLEILNSERYSFIDDLL